MAAKPKPPRDRDLEPDDPPVERPPHAPPEPGADLPRPTPAPPDGGPPYPVRPR